jgi:hypothetical protein
MLQSSSSADEMTEGRPCMRIGGLWIRWIRATGNARANEPAAEPIRPQILWL